MALSNIKRDDFFGLLSGCEVLSLTYKGIAYVTNSGTIIVNGEEIKPSGDAMQEMYEQYVGDELCKEDYLV